MGFVDFNYMSNRIDTHTDCLICGKHNSIMPVWDTVSVVSSEVFTIGACNHCHVECVLNVPDDLSSYYKDQNMQTESNRFYIYIKKLLLNVELGRIAKRIPINSLVVDIGCGSGEFSELMMDKGFRTVGIDALESPPKRLISKPSFKYGQIDYKTYEIKGGLELNEGVVILRHVLEHIFNPMEFLIKLKDRGVKYFYIVVPNHDCIECKLFGQYNFFYIPPLHLWFFRKRSLEKLFLNLHFEILDQGFDTIPNTVPSIYKLMSMKNFPKRIIRLFDPRGILSTLSAPFNFLLPNNVMWFVVKVSG